MSVQSPLLPAVRPVARPVAAPRERRPRPDGSGGPAARRRVARAVVRWLLVALALLVAALAWVGVRGGMAVSTLVRTAPAFADVGTSLASGPTPTLLASADEVRTATARARGLVDDPVWGALEHLPWLGQQLETVRAVTVAADVLAADALGPVVALAGELSLGPYGEGEGYAALVAAAELEADLDQVAQAVLRADAALDGVTGELAVPGVSEQLQGAVTTLHQVADVAGAVGPGVRGALQVVGHPAGSTTALAVLDARAPRPLGGAVERVYLLSAGAGVLDGVEPLDAGAVLAAASASPPFAAAAAGPQGALLQGRAADVTALASTPDAAAALAAGVAAVTGVTPGAVVLVSVDGLEALASGTATDAGSAGSLAAGLEALAPEQRAPLLDAAVEGVVRTTLGLTVGADRVALALRDAVVSGGLRVWFADAGLQADLAGTRGAGALPERTAEGIPATVAVDAATPEPVVEGLTAAAGRCGALWSARPVLALDLVLAEPVPSDAAPGARLVVGLAPGASVLSVTGADGGDVPFATVELPEQRLLVVEHAEAGRELHVRVAGRGADDEGGLSVATRGAVPAPGAAAFACR